MEPPFNLLAWLVADDEESRPFRAERLAFLLEHFGAEERGMLFHGGIIPATAFDEMRLCYLNGLFVSCTVVAQIVIEHTLARMLDMAGRNDLKGAPFQILLVEAKKERFISPDEFDEMDKLRRLRNPYTHSKPFVHESNFLRRALDTGVELWDLFNDDAEKAVIAVFTLLARQPFTFESSEEDQIE